MGKAARLNMARRAQYPDPHRPDVTTPIVAGTQDPRTGRVAIPRRADFWRELPGRQVACDLCYRACVLRPGEAGWCKIRENAGGVLRIPEHGVVGSLTRHRLPYFHFRAGALAVFVGGVSCTAGCTFCISEELSLHPDRLPWLNGERAGAGARDSGWARFRAVVHPKGVLGVAGAIGARDLRIGNNEPTLTYEFTLDLCRLAGAAGLRVAMDSNGFSSPDAIAALAPHVDTVYLGIKGSLDPDFYDRRMRSPGATPHVLAAAKAWRDSPTRLCVSDTIAPPHWTGEAEATEHMKRLYGWIAEELGPLTPVEVRPMLHPRYYEPGRETLLLPRGGAAWETIEAFERWHLAVALARDAGLAYVYSGEDAVVSCHACGAVLLADLNRPSCVLDVGEDGRCGGCGGATPIVGIARAEYDELMAELAAAPPDAGAIAAGT